MRLLALDTADEYCTLALSEKGALVAAISLEAGREQTKRLAPLAEEFLKNNKTDVMVIDRFAICTGPGSFTGLRVGIAFARGLALAAQRPLYGFDHFACTRAAFRRFNKATAPLLILRASGREEMFACLIEAGEDKGQSFLATATQLATMIAKRPEILFTGNGVAPVLEEQAQLSPRYIPLPREEIVLSACLLAAAAGKAEDHPSLPLYLREADVTFAGA